jgi:hypothetical protein
MKSGANTISRIVTCVALMLASGMVLFGGTGCDIDVQTALVSGMNDAAVTAATALIDAAFQTVTHDYDDPSDGVNSGDTNNVPSV